MVELVNRRVDASQSIRIRYEDFVDDPKSTLNQLSSILGIDFDDLACALNAGDTMLVGHNIAGNRLRMAKTVKLRPNVEWRHKLPVWDRRLFWFAAWPLMRRYGYGRLTSDSPLGSDSV